MRSAAEPFLGPGSLPLSFPQRARGKAGLGRPGSVQPATLRARAPARRPALRPGPAQPRPQHCLFGNKWFRSVPRPGAVTLPPFGSSIPLRPRRRVGRRRQGRRFERSRPGCRAVCSSGKHGRLGRRGLRGGGGRPRDRSRGSPGRGVGGRARPASAGLAVAAGPSSGRAVVPPSLLIKNVFRWWYIKY